MRKYASKRFEFDEEDQTKQNCIVKMLLDKGKKYK